MTVLRRLDAVLEPTKQAVLEVDDSDPADEFQLDTENELEADETVEAHEGLEV